MSYAEAFELLISIVKRFEGCELVAYLCPAGIWTIGYGETAGVKAGDVWTQEKAESVLRRRVGQFYLATLKRCPALHLESAERWIACTSLSYNIGVGAFGASSVCRKTMRQEFAGAAESFLLWNKGGGRVLKGLTTRRHAERKIYLSASSQYNRQQ